MIAIRRYILITGIIVIVLIVVIVYLLITYSKIEEVAVRPTVSPRPTFLSFPTITKFPDLIIPKDPEITISGIRVKNFYLYADSVSQSGDVLFGKTSNYEIVYLPSDKRFILSITSSPFDRQQKEAEEALVALLGITQQDACMLKAEVTTPLYANPDFAGRRFVLSFCAHIP